MSRCHCCRRVGLGTVLAGGLFVALLIQIWPLTVALLAGAVVWGGLRAWWQQPDRTVGVVSQARWSNRR